MPQSAAAARRMWRWSRSVSCSAEPRADVSIALDDALSALATIGSRKSQVVELRVFEGLDVEENGGGPASIPGGGRIATGSSRRHGRGGS